MNKWKERLLNIKFKKAGIIFSIICIIFILAAGGITAIRFGPYIETIASQEEQDSNDNTDKNDADTKKFNEKKEKGDRKEKNQGEDVQDREEALGREDHQDGEHNHDFEYMLNLNNGDEMILEVISAIAAILFAIYWLLVLLWMVQKCYLTGADPLIFGVLTLLFNLAAVIGFYIYRYLKTKCPICERLQNKNHEYCPNCGTILVAKCKNCGANMKLKDEYCSLCGTKKGTDKKSEASQEEQQKQNISEEQENHDKE